jgi:hypothetical protein
MQLSKGNLMNHTRKILAVLVLAALGGAASAQGLSRAQVRAELAAAQRNGDMLTADGIPMRDLRPDLYPQRPASHLARAKVEAQVLQARHDGTLIEASGLREKDLAPGMYPRDPVVASGKSRAAVEAELAMAIRDGDMLAPGDAGVTEAQLRPAYYAHQRAIDEASQLARHAPADAGATSVH